MKVKIGLLVVLLGFITLSCNQEDANKQTSTIETEDIAVSASVDAMSDDISRIVIEQFGQQSGNNGRGGDSSQGSLPTCATVNTVVSSEKWTRTVDFGNEGCLLSNGNVLKGKIIISGNLEFGQSSYTITCNFENFHHNGFSVKGTKLITVSKKSTDLLAEVHPVFDVVIDFTVTQTKNGVVRTFKGNRVVELIEGADTTEDSSDNVFKVTGSQVMVSPKGTITANVTEPLVLKQNCVHIVKGIIVFTKNISTASIDYGDGTCDDSAVVIIGGFSTTITLGKK